MVHRFKLDLSKIKPSSRDEHLAKLRQFTQAQKELEDRCKELGIPVPQMVC